MSPNRGDVEDAAQHAEAAAREALLRDADTTTLKALLERAEIARRLVPAPTRRAGATVLPLLGVAGLCLLLAAFAASINPSASPLRLEARVDSLRLRLTAPWSLPAPLKVSAISAQELSQIGGGDIGDRAADAFALTGAATLSALSFSAGTELALDATSDGWRLFVSQGSLAGAIDLKQGTLSVGAEAKRRIQTQPDSPPWALRFNGQRGDADAVPVRLEVVTVGEWRFTGLVADDIQFSRETSPGAGRWMSTIQSATARFQAVDEDIELTEGDELRLEGVRSNRLTLERDGRDIKLLLQGSVRRLNAGPEGHAEDLTPSWLDALTHNKRAGQIWAAVLFVWGLFGGLLLKGRS